MRKIMMTVPKLTDLIELGRGMGVGDGYQPWITLARHNTSSVSNQSYVRMPCLARHCTFLSRSERFLAHVLWWAGALDVREQFPLWPWSHPSPYQELDEVPEWPQHPGMIKVARGAGIKLYRYPGLPIPAILTIDLMVTVGWSGGKRPRLIGISCKPQDQYLHAGPADRLRERLELDHRYCEAGGIEHLLLHPEQLPLSLVRQLEWLAPRATQHELRAVRQLTAYRKFVERLQDRVYTVPASRAFRAAGRAVGWDAATSYQMGRTAIWLLDIDVDVSVPVVLHAPLRTGGIALRSEIRRRIFGEDWSCN